MEKLIKRLYQCKIVANIFHTLVFCLNKALKDCDSVLDLGCGQDSPIKYCHVSYSVGVDAFEAYIRKSKKNKVHNKYLNKRIEELDFPENSFDAVILIEVLEHLSKKSGGELLKKAHRWATKKIVVSTPNGYLASGSVDDNPFQSHVSGYTVKEMRQKGFRVYGLAGCKFLRQTGKLEKTTQDGAIFSTIRFRPQVFWLMISALTQIVVYYFPSLAFEMFCVKKIEPMKKV